MSNTASKSSHVPAGSESSPRTIRAVLYLRLSRTSEKSTAIDGQNAELLAHADSMGWKVVRALADDGESGAKRRANADDALRMLRDGEADLLAVYAVDRWTRQGLEAVGELCGVLRTSGTSFYALRERLSSTSDSFELELGIHASIAKREWELIAGRVRASRKRLDAAGRFKGGAVPFGYQAVRRADGTGVDLLHDPGEAEAVRYIRDAVLERRTLSHIANHLMADGVPTTTSPARRARQAGGDWEGLERGVWRVQTLRQLAISPTLAGMTTAAEYKDGRLKDGSTKIVREADGRPRMISPDGGLISQDDHQALKAIFHADGQARKRVNRAARLLSGIAYCGRCDTVAHVTQVKGMSYYRCGARSNDHNSECSSPSIGAEALEEFVLDRILNVIGDVPEYIETTSAVDTATAEREALASQLADAWDAVRDPSSDRVAIMDRINALETRISELENVPAVTETSHTPTGRTIREAIEQSDTHNRRILVGRYVDHVTFVGRQRPNTLDARVAIRWTEESEANSFVLGVEG